MSGAPVCLVQLKDKAAAAVELLVTVRVSLGSVFQREMSALALDLWTSLLVRLLFQALLKEFLKSRAPLKEFLKCLVCQKTVPEFLKSQAPLKEFPKCPVCRKMAPGFLKYLACPKPLKLLKLPQFPKLPQPLKGFPRSLALRRFLASPKNLPQSLEFLAPLESLQ